MEKECKMRKYLGLLALLLATTSANAGTIEMGVLGQEGALVVWFLCSPDEPFSIPAIFIPLL
jgi:hypothetical protein